MFILRRLLAVFLIASASAAQAEPKVSIGHCGDADILLEFKGATARHPLIEELRAAMKQKSAARFSLFTNDTSEISLHLRDRRSNAVYPAPTDSLNMLRCIEKRGESYLLIWSDCGCSAIHDIGEAIFWVNRWRYVADKGATSADRQACDWECLVHWFGRAFEIEDHMITTLLEDGDPATYDTPPKKKRRHAALTLPTGAECEAIFDAYMDCVKVQLASCSKTLTFSDSMNPPARRRYFDIVSLNTKFDFRRFEATCSKVCRKGAKPLKKKVIAANFCG